MNTIIHEIMGKVITDYGKIMEKLIDNIVEGKGEISEVNKKLEEMLDEIGVMLVKHILETIDDIVRDSEARKKKGYNIEKTGLTGINDNVVAKTATINELVVHLESKDADAAIVTEDCVHGNENIEAIEIPKDINIQQIIPIGTLKNSENIEQANEFVDFVSSDKGKAIFEKHGFPPVK